MNVHIELDRDYIDILGHTDCVHKGIVLRHYICGGGGDIYRSAQKFRQSRCRSAHHLVHNLAGGTHAQIIKLEIVGGRVVNAHELIEYKLNIPLAENHYVSSLKTLGVGYLDYQSRLQRGILDKTELFNADTRSGDIYDFVQHG